MKLSDAAGVWVKNEDMDPAINIAGRQWMTEDGEHTGIYHGLGSRLPSVPFLWHFPVAPKQVKR